MSAPEKEVLGIVGEMPSCRHEGGLYLHRSLGRVVQELARRHEQVLLCLPLREGPPTPDQEVRIQQANVHVVPQPYYGSSMAALRRFPGIVRAYFRLCRRADYLFVRGMLPYVGLFYLFALLFGRRPCHWVVGNPIVLLKADTSRGWLARKLAIAYARTDRFFARIGRRLTRGAFICCGQELAGAYRSRRTRGVYSSTLDEEEFFERDDTCGGQTVGILLVSFVRPAKGIEYLVRAVSRLKTDRPWRLTVVGSWERDPSHKAELDRLAESLSVAGRITWAGYVDFGEPLEAYFRAADLFAFPTLSEGTPHVIPEAMAHCLPVVTTNVGGIGSLVEDGVNGLLVPPKDPDAMAAAIDRVIADGALRRQLIRNGLSSARALTVSRFVEYVSAVVRGGEV